MKYRFLIVLLPLSTLARADITSLFQPPSTTTVSFNGVGQQVTSTYTVVTDTWSINVNATLTPVALTTVTFNGQAQQVTSTYTVVTDTWSINVNASLSLSTAAVNGSTTAVVNAVGTQLTVVSTGLPVNATQTGTWTVQPGNTQNTTSWQVTSTGTVVTAGAGSFTITPASSGTYTVTPGTGTYTMTSGTGSWTVTPGTGTFNVFTQNKSSSVVQVVITSTALQGTSIQGSTTTLTGDAIGRLLTASLPWGILTATTNANVASAISEVVIVASAAASNYNYLCDCMFANTANATQTISVYQTTSTLAGIDFFTVAISSFQTVFYGSTYGCSDPIMRSKVGGQLTLKPSAVVTSTAMRCRYYAGP